MIRLLIISFLVISSLAQADTLTRCFGDELQKNVTYSITSNAVATTRIITTTKTCAYGCGNITGSEEGQCLPAPQNRSFIVFGLAIVIIGLAWFIERSKRLD